MRLLNFLLGLFRFNKKNWKAVVLCILAATIFWVLNSLNKEYTANINFPISFEYDHKYYIPVQALPDEISLNVTGLGWDLFRRSLRFNTPSLEVPLDKPSETKKIVGSTLASLFSKQLETMQINFIGQDTLYLDLRVRSKRWLRLTIDSVERHLAMNYALVDSVHLIPDSVFIEGPINVVAALDEPYPIHLQDRNIAENYKEEIELDLPPLVSRSPASVEVSFRVERYIDVTDSIPLDVLNAPSGANLKMSMNHIPVTLRIRESMRHGMRDSLRAEVNLAGFKKGSLHILPTLKGLPPDSEVVQLDTLYISY